MAIRPENLDNPEQDMDLLNRGPKGAKKAQDDIERVKHGKPTADAELDAMRARVGAAKAIKPEGRDLHCSDCAQAFANGRDAAVRVIEG